jgi:hypothetical protein
MKKGLKCPQLFPIKRLKAKSRSGKEGDQKTDYLPHKHICKLELNHIGKNAKIKNLEEEIKNECTTNRRDESQSF